MITLIELTTIIVGQIWHPYAMYNPFHNLNLHQGASFFDLKFLHTS